jgi:hypothetical protein
MSSSAPVVVPAGWYLDPAVPGTQRWWDGASWTEQVAPAAPVVPPQTFGPRSLVWGIIAVVLPFVILPAGVALYFSIPALVTARRMRANGQQVSIKMPLAGLILASVSLLFTVGSAVVTYAMR